MSNKWRQFGHVPESTLSHLSRRWNSSWSCRTSNEQHGCSYLYLSQKVIIFNLWSARSHVYMPHAIALIIYHTNKIVLQVKWMLSINHEWKHWRYPRREGHGDENVWEEREMERKLSERRGAQRMKTSLRQWSEKFCNETDDTGMERKMCLRGEEYRERKDLWDSKVKSLCNETDGTGMYREWEEILCISLVRFKSNLGCFTCLSSAFWLYNCIMGWVFVAVHTLKWQPPLPANLCPHHRCWNVASTLLGCSSQHRPLLRLHDYPEWHSFSCTMSALLAGVDVRLWSSQNKQLQLVSI